LAYFAKVYKLVDELDQRVSEVNSETDSLLATSEELAATEIEVIDTAKRMLRTRGVRVHNGNQKMARLPLLPGCFGSLNICYRYFPKGVIAIKVKIVFLHRVRV